jgi:NitT/TauT family transport system substrate-binding protein
MVGTVPWAGSEPLFLAREQGAFPSERIRLVEYLSSADMIRAFRNGALDAVALSLEEVLRLDALEQELKIVLVIDFSNGADCVVARPEVKTLAELEGRRVAMEDMALGRYVLGRALERVGLELEDIQRVPAKLDSHLAVYQRGEVDAVVTFEPNCQRLVDAGAHVLFDSSLIPGEILDVVAVRTSYLQAHPERVDLLLRGWFAALDYQQAHPDEAVSRMAPRLGIDARQLREALRGVHVMNAREQHELLMGSPPRLLERIQALRAVMVGDGLLPARPRDDSRLIEASSFQRVAP